MTTSTQGGRRIGLLRQRSSLFGLLSCAAMLVACGHVAASAGQSPIAASATSGDATSSLAPRSGEESATAGCGRTFDIEADPSLAHGATPASAVANFIAHGSTLGAMPGTESPVAYGFPSSGWELASQDAQSATFKSGNDSLYVALLAPSLWEVHSGVICNG